MVVNAGVEYVAAEQKYHNAKTKEEKLEGLMEMLRTIPKHKASESARRELTNKIAKLRMEIEKDKAVASSKKSSIPSLSIKKEGIAQIAIIGMPNSGKSTLLNKLTGAETEVAPYQFTTTKPVVAMMDYKGTQIQLVEMPALIEGSNSGKANGTQILSSIRNADALLILCTTEDEKKVILSELAAAEIKLNVERPKIIIKTGDYKGLSFAGTNFLRQSQEEIINALKAHGVTNASVIFSEPTTVQTIAEVLNTRITYKKAFFLNAYEDPPVDDVKKKIFALIGKIIVYTKKPGQEPDLNDPLVLDIGATVEECAGKLHKDIARNLKSVKVWGSAKYPGQNVSKDYPLQDGDIVEFSS